MGRSMSINAPGRFQPVDLDLLEEQASSTPDEGLGNLLTCMGLAICEYGYVIVYEGNRSEVINQLVKDAIKDPAFQGGRNNV